MKNKFYVYRFLDKDDNTIYIGRTNNLERRLTQEHFSRHGHLPVECYRECHSIEYMEFDSETEMKIYEVYCINIHNPKYNVIENKNDDFTFSLKEHWTKFKINDIISKKEYKVYNYIIMTSEHYHCRTELYLNHASRDLKLKELHVHRILLSLEKKGYIGLEQYGRYFRITHSLRDLKFPKEDLDE
ncbi:nucleotide excision repair endonuclease [Bacillus phage vB_BanS-Thrax5]|nr:nucleotide excision repair endonuclease [Bacillus phage vB_BanS-Thrax5]